FRRDTGRGLARHEPQKAEREHAEHERRQHRVYVECPELSRLHRLRQERQVVRDVLGRRVVRGGHREFCWKHHSRMNKATRNSNTAPTKPANSAGTPASWYVASTSHSRPTITR